MPSPEAGWIQVGHGPFQSDNKFPPLPSMCPREIENRTETRASPSGAAGFAAALRCSVVLEAGQIEIPPFAVRAELSSPLNIKAEWGSFNSWGL